MPWFARLIATSSFRIVVIYQIFFLTSSSVLLGWLYWNTVSAARRDVDAQIEAEAADLASHYRNGGLYALVQTLHMRLSGSDSDRLYRLSDPLGRTLIGNVQTPPGLEATALRISDFVYRYADPFTGADVSRYARGREMFLDQNMRLFIGYDIDAAARFEERILTSILWGLTLIAGVGFCAGVWFSRGILNRVEEMNAAMRDIVSGKFTRRIPIKGSSDEFDRLSAEINAMLSRIEDLMQAMREVTDNIAHDLRSPLNRLRNRVEIVLSRDPDAADQRKALEETLEEVDDVLGIFNALLEISRTESDRLPLQEALPEDMGSIVRDVVDFYQPAAEERSILLSGVATPAAFFLHCKRSLINQALSNLIENAMAALGGGADEAFEGAEIRVRAIKRFDGVELAVKDNGPGIPEAMQKKVMERFVRLERSRHRSGSGLGLSLVSAVARYHGGAFYFLPVARGSCGVLRLPSSLFPDRTS